jgi:phosphoribosylanthranilate isomerase
MKIKVCGMTDPVQVKELSFTGADFCGLIFYKGSKRYVEERGKDFINEMKSISINKIGVFVNEEIADVLKTVDAYKLFGVQLHGDESPEYCRELKKYTCLIKAFRLKDGDDVDAMIQPFQEEADYFLFDNGTSGYGGTGIKFNWDLLRHALVSKPFFISGGIGLDNLAGLQNFHHPFLYAVDINSRFEISPGMKNLDEVKLFISSIHSEK